MSEGTMTIAGRSEEIRGAINTMLEAIREWQDDETKVAFTEGLETAIGASLNVCLSGDIPQDCLELFQPLSGLARIWASIQEGQTAYLDNDGLPSRDFWREIDRIREMMTIRQAEGVKALEPVAVLLKELEHAPNKWLSIAKIYGLRDPETGVWRGPLFVGDTGSPNIEAILKEGEQPGSVVPAGYNPLRLHREKQVQQSKSALAAIQEKLAQKTIEKQQAATERQSEILEVLRQGQTVEGVCNGWGVSREYVLSLCEEHAIEPAYASDLMKRPTEPNPPAETKLPGEVATPSPASRDADAPAPLPSDEDGFEDFFDAAESSGEGEAGPQKISGDELRAVFAVYAAEGVESREAAAARLAADGYTAAEISITKLWKAVSESE